MKIIERIRKGGGELVSIEIEPPIIGRGIEGIYASLDPLVNAGVKYISITYHSERILKYARHRGKTFPIFQRKKPGTLGIAGALMGRYGAQNVEPIPHVICTQFTRYETEEYLVELGFLGIKNIVALRGDPPKGPGGEFLEFPVIPEGHGFAANLIKQIVDLRNAKYVGAQEGSAIDFCVGAACYPEGYQDSLSDEDIKRMKMKVEAGADFFITQMFFDNENFFRFRRRAEKAGVKAPIIPGIFPFHKLRYLDFLPKFFGCSLPENLASGVEIYKNSPDDIKKLGVDWCVRQCSELKKSGVPGLHFFTHGGAPVREVIEAMK